jgi:hypothetical protein
VIKAWRCLAVFTVFVSCAVISFSSTAFKPNTTLSVETGNNTSTPNSFAAQSNGNAAAGNISKVDIRELLYPGATTAIYAHYMPWFGASNHMDVGYSSVDPDQVARQVDDMISRGIQGVIIDWYGPNSSHADLSTTLVMKEAEKHPGFRFAIMEDAGASRNTADPTATVIADLTYAWQTYQVSPAYMKVDNRPVVFFFGLELLPIDWTAVRSRVPGNPIFVFQNSGSFSNQYAEAGFSWVGSSTDPNNWGKSYLDDFYTKGIASKKHIVGSVKKGFNDTLAAWGKNRIVNQNCGQTWLSTFGIINQYFSATKQLEFLQLVTWNDYEEGTALEMGIENCVAVEGTASGNKLTWTVTGQENTIHHYSVYISVDGENLMKFAEVPAGTHELDLAQFAFDAGSYTVYVKAVGQPSIRNHVSGAIGYSVAATPAVADLKLSATPQSLSLTRGGTVSADVLLVPTGNFSRPVSLSCSNLPVGMNCSFDRASVVPGEQSATVKLTLHSSATSANVRSLSLVFAFFAPTFGIFLLNRRDRRGKAVLLSAILLMATVSLVGCAGLTSSGSQQPQASKPETYQFSIVAQAENFQKSFTAAVTVQ